MNSKITRILRFRKVLLGRDFYQSRQIKCARLTYGNRYAEWTFCPDHLTEDSLVYSFGVGEDISFELALMENLKLQVHAFDPSPRSINWVQQQHLRKEFHFHSFGLSGQDGEIIFVEPDEPGVHSLMKVDSVEAENTGLITHKLPVHRLPTIIEKLGHQRIDILKMDIEGAEYEVIEDIITSRVPISQVLIEFHHRFDNVGIGRTRQAIERLNKAGYLIFDVSASGEEISFIKNSP